MAISHVYTALIDILAYRYRLESDQKSGLLTFKDDLEQALKVFDSVNDAFYRVQAISDTIIITCSEHNHFPEFTSILKNVFIEFLRRGLFIRGGIAYSRHFQSGRLTYSHSIAKAYELESKISIYPRIVIDNNIMEMYVGGVGMPDIFNKRIFSKQNGVTFLNIVDDENWVLIYTLAKKIYENDKNHMLENESAFLKHLWFQEYIFSSGSRDRTCERYIEAISEV
ncbi:hypothetical protein GURASL_31200 [Geotalea uraniireducens]|uniref:Uncharacterized protein n=1 Tax=Geotalea uraniireducens TaxID=351604 RepID=A0ABN6VXP1_9BACT|nr:hypothetical protein [Geotalea uraniireducens]BDV44197.1 hypothetical protein GURASL_31200 [Geotalea uraniireducens]